jgi:hypothetical protein
MRVLNFLTKHIHESGEKYNVAFCSFLKLESVYTHLLNFAMYLHAPIRPISKDELQNIYSMTNQMRRFITQ